MKILLVYPYFLDPRLNAEDIQSPPIGIYYVAAFLQARGHSVEVLNWHDRTISPEGMAEVLREKKPGVIGFSVLHANRWGGIEIARLAKRIDPGVKVVFGGVGATHLWEHFLEHFPYIDFIVIGEGEYTFGRLVESFEAGHPPILRPSPDLPSDGPAGRLEPIRPRQCANSMHCPCRAGISTWRMWR